VEKDFRIGESNELVHCEETYDVHNLYDFAGVSIGRKSELSVSFIPNPEYGENMPSLTLWFSDIDYLEFSEGLGTQVIFGIEEFGYKAPGDRDDDWLGREEHAEAEDHLFMRLTGDEFIRVHAKRATLIIGTENVEPS
jgi:hypothetical protein